MKNIFKVFGFIAIIAIALIGCSNDTTTTETFTVTYHANGGTPAPQAQTVEKGKTATEPPAMTKSNSDFDGWYKENGFSTKWNFASDTVTTNIDLHAKWETYYGTLPNGVKIYKGEGAEVTDEQMATAVQNVIAGYNGLSAAVMAMVQGKFTKVIIISDKNYSWDGSVLGLKFDRSVASITGRFESVADGSLTTTN